MSHSSDSKGNGESSTSANTLASARSDDAPANQADLQAALKARLIASGEYERLLGVLKNRLDASGWEDSLRGVAREKVRAQEPMVPSLPNLVNEIEPLALESIPTEIRTELLSMIQTFVEKNVED